MMNLSVLLLDKCRSLFNSRAKYFCFILVGLKNDLRFLDKKGVIVGLKAKAKAKKDKSGFVK